MSKENEEVIERNTHPLDNPIHIMKIKCNYCTIGYNTRDVEKYHFIFKIKV